MVHSTEDGKYLITNNKKTIREALNRFSQHHLSVLLMNEQAKIFYNLDKGCVGFVDSGKYILSIGGIMASKGFESELLDAFLEWADKESRSVGFVHFPPSNIAILNQRGFRTNQIGSVYSKRFEGSKLAGKQYQQVRRKLNKALRSNVIVEEITNSENFMELRSDLKEINHAWLKNKKAKQLRHLVFDFETMTVPDADNRLFVAYHNKQLVSYTIFTRTYGSDAGWFCNLTRYKEGCVDGTMQLIMSNMLDSTADTTVHFGFTPLVEMGDDKGSHSKIFSRVANKLASYGGIVYPSRSQRQYKVSWNPTEINAEYFAYRAAVLPAVYSLLRITDSI